MPLSVTNMLCQAIKASRQQLDDHSSNTTSSSSGTTGVLTNAHVQVAYRTH